MESRNKACEIADKNCIDLTKIIIPQDIPMSLDIFIKRKCKIEISLSTVNRNTTKVRRFKEKSIDNMQPLLLLCSHYINILQCYSLVSPFLLLTKDDLLTLCLHSTATRNCDKQTKSLRIKFFKS